MRSSAAPLVIEAEAVRMTAARAQAMVSVAAMHARVVVAVHLRASRAVVFVVLVSHAVVMAVARNVPLHHLLA